MKDMTDAERLEEINSRHWKVGVARTVYPGQCACGLAWPCDTAVAVAEAERLRSESSAAVGAAAKYLAEVERLRGEGNNISREAERIGKAFTDLEAEVGRLRERVRELEGTVTAGLIATEQISRALKPFVAKLAAGLGRLEA